MIETEELLQDIEAGIIYETDDYSKFRFRAGNRSTTRKHTNKLISSIEEYGWLNNPILVNEELEIIDGQHRFEALRQLNLPIFYIVERGYGDTEIIALNAYQKNWSDIDYIHKYVEEGKEDYITVLEFKEKYNFSLNFAVALLRGANSVNMGSDTRHNLKIGELKVTQPISGVLKANLFIELFTVAPNLKDNTSFLNAMFNIFNVEGYDHTRMHHVLTNKEDEVLSNLDSRRTCTLALQKIYNSNLETDRRLRFWEDPL